MNPTSSLPQRGLVLAVTAMTLVVIASNVLVQFPVRASIGPVALGDILTWGAFTYPFAFLVTDLTNRRFGPIKARIVVAVGFVTAVALSSVIATPRIAVASGSAFLAAQLLDVTVFNRLRRRTWWRAPLAASTIGSLLDTATFFGLAFAPAFVVLGPNDPFAIGSAPLFGVLPDQAPRFVSWALGDLSVKMLAALVLLLPYRAIIPLFVPWGVAQPRSGTA